MLRSNASQLLSYLPISSLVTDGGSTPGALEEGEENSLPLYKSLQARVRTLKDQKMARLKIVFGEGFCFFKSRLKKIKQGKEKKRQEEAAKKWYIK